MPEGKQITSEEYVQAVRGFNCGQGLTAIGQLSRAMEFDDPALEQSILARWIPRTVNQWQLAFFAKALIEHSNDYKSKGVGDKDLLFACDLYNQIIDPFVGNPSVEASERDVHNFLVRTAFEQFPYQLGNYRNEVARAFVLFEEIAEAAKGDGFDIPDAFLKLSGLSVRDFMINGVAYWAQAGKPIVAPMTTSVASLKDILTPEKQGKFLALTAADYSGFRLCQEMQEKKPGFERFQFNCLNTYPLIKPDRFMQLLCPIPNLLLRRFTRGLYYYLLDEYSGGGKQSTFSAFFGKFIFERYVGDQLKSYFDPEKVLGERKIGESDLSCDWIVVEDRFVILIECKTTGLTVRGKTFAETEQLTEDLKRRIVSGVKACERTRNAIESGQPGLEGLAGKQTINLVVLYDEVYLFNAPPYRNIVEDELKKAGLPGVAYQVTPIAELEYTLPTLAKAGFGNLLSEKMADGERQSWDLLTFTQGLVKEGKADEPEPNRILTAKFKAVFEPLLRPDKPGFSGAEP